MDLYLILDVWYYVQQLNRKKIFCDWTNYFHGMDFIITSEKNFLLNSRPVLNLKEKEKRTKIKKTLRSQ